MKLISMTSFIEEQEKLIPATEHGSVKDWDRVYVQRTISYCRFLRQPLTLGMFVPVGEAGNILPIPIDYYESEIHNYKNACARVLFEGFEFPCDEWYKDTKTVSSKSLDMILYLDSNQISVNQSLGIGFGEVKNIEDLVSYGLTLTPSALKQIGL